MNNTITFDDIVKDYLYNDKSEIMEKYETYGKFVQLGISFIVKKYSESLDKCKKFQKYLSGYHNSRCKFYKLDEQDLEGDLNFLIDNHCNDSDVLEHYIGMVVNGQASYEGL